MFSTIVLNFRTEKSWVKTKAFFKKIASHNSSSATAAFKKIGYCKVLKNIKTSANRQ